MSLAGPPPAVQGTATQDHRTGARAKGDGLEQAIAACARALGGGAQVTLAFGGAEQEADPAAGRVTRRAPDMPAAARAALRGEADLAGLYRAHHDPDHMASVMSDREARVLRALERARVEAIGGAEYRGVAHNLSAALEERCLKPHYAEAAGEILQAEALAMLLRERLAPAALPARRFGFVEARRAALSAALAPHLDALASALRHQRRFAEAALRLARSLRPEAGEALAEGAAEPNEPARGDRDPGPIQGEQKSQGEASGLKSATEEATEDAPLFGQPEATEARISGELDSATMIPVDDAATQSARRTGGGALQARSGYRVFTTAFDRTAAAEALLAELSPPPEEEEPDGFAGRRREAARLATRLRRSLLALQPRGWERDQPEGLLDPARLARVVTDPASGRFFRQEKNEPFADTVVTLLLDNSSSMRGEPLKIVALTTELMAQAIESSGVRVEALGFTTRNWRGGRAREAWLAAGKPADPGRVSELLHIVYKAADAPARGLRRALKLLQVKGLPKENVDGEALDWACRRLLRRPERRRILIMISDGAPSEETTLSLSSHPGNYLEAHLRETIAEIDRRGMVELFAIGIGYDVGRLYPKAVRIDSAEGLAPALAAELPRLLARRTT